MGQVIHGLALCAGAGGLELGVRLALRGRYRVVGCVGRDVYAAAVLAARMADGALDPAPIWDDLAADPLAAPALPKSPVRRAVDGAPAGVDVDPLADRSDRLRAVGNSVCPACAAAALLHLLERYRGDR